VPNSRLKTELATDAAENQTMNLHPPRVLNVGQCHIDGPWMKRVLEQHLGAVVEGADSAREAVDKARQNHYQLILVNRELAQDNSSGLDVVSELIALNPQTPVMIVSDYEVVQAAAEQQGALRGFGKSDLESTETLERLAETVRPAHSKKGNDIGDSS
jgi:DNA-binding NarL/FixJ family response regulator